MEAFFENEKDTGIPVDRITINPDNKTLVLALPKDLFYIQATNNVGKVFFSHRKKVSNFNKDKKVFFI